MEAHTVTIDQLPDDVLAVIFSSFPSFRDVCRSVAGVNKHWAAVSHDADIWMHYWAANDFGELPSPTKRHADGMQNLFKEEVTIKQRWLGGKLAFDHVCPIKGMFVISTQWLRVS